MYNRKSKREFSETNDTTIKDIPTPIVKKPSIVDYFDSTENPRAPSL